MDQDDVLIIGGGAAAFAAATRAADLETKVTIVNDGLPLGGTCVNVGCVPSKFLLDSLKHAHHARNSREGWLETTASLDYGKLRKAKDDLVGQLRKMNYHDVIKSLGNVTLVEGRARFTAPRTVEVNGDELSADRVIIATGARTFIPPVEGLAEMDPLTNVTALDLEQVPERLAVVGGGPLGLEFAQIFARAGADVSDIELMGRILPQHEPEVSQALAESLAAEGITVKAGCRLERVERAKDGTLRLFDDGGCVAQADAVLAATGIRPNTDDLGLEAAGVEIDEQGFVKTDERQATTADGVYAAGDVTGTMPLETTAAKQGYNAAHNALTDEARTIDYDLVPHAVFTDPQVASVGWTEEAQMEKTGTCWCMTLPMEHVPRAHATGDTAGLVKLVADPETREIKGAHAVSKNAAEIIHIPVMAMRAGFTLDDLIETVHTFPTYAEAWKMCAQAFDRPVESMSCCIV